MKELITKNIIPSIKSKTIQLTNVQKLKQFDWIKLDVENTVERTVYIFKSNNKLFVSKDANVRILTWEVLSFNKLMIEDGIVKTLYRYEVANDNKLLLMKEQSFEAEIFVSEERYLTEINALLNGGNLPSPKKIDNNHTKQITTWDAIKETAAIILFLLIVFVVAIIWIQNK